MIKFTKEEISLCKQVAKKGVSFEPPDDWHGAYHVFQQDKTYPWADGEDKPYYKSDEFVWIATISDCLEFLYKKYEEVGVESLLPDYWEASVYLHRKIKDAEVIDAKGKTPLEACLKVVLAVLGKKR